MVHTRDAAGDGSCSLEKVTTIDELNASILIDSLQEDLVKQQTAADPDKLHPDRESTPQPRVNRYPELETLYEMHETIGHGGFSKVKRATEIETGREVAIKIVDKEHVGELELPRIEQEINTLRTMNHPHLCRLLNVHYSKEKVFVVMEYCPTDLYEYIVKQEEFFPEAEVRRIFIQLMSAVAHVHSYGICHRDLKPENVLLDAELNVRLTDFGLCAIPPKGGIHKPILRTLCGSPAYCAPELLVGPPYIGSKIDVWSLGVILYVLFAQQLPFYSKNLKELYKKIQEVQYVTPSWASEGAKDVIDRLLQADPAFRPSLNRLWAHPWIQDGLVSLNYLDKEVAAAAVEVLEEPPGICEHDFGRRLEKEDGKSSGEAVGYMDVGTRIAEYVFDGDNDDFGRDVGGFLCFSWLRKKWAKRRAEKVVKQNETSTPQPREFDLGDLCNTNNISGLTAVHEEFAEGVLERLEKGLRTIGISSRRKGTMLKNGSLARCKFKFEVISIRPSDVLCIRRRYIYGPQSNEILVVAQNLLLSS